MAEKASQIVSDALGNLSVRAAELPLTQDEISTGIRYMNRMAAALDAEKIDLGYTVVTAPNDLVTVPDGAVEAFVDLLTIKLASPFKKPITSAIGAAAQSALQTLQAITIQIGASEYPSTLPRGSGNDSCTNTSHFYQPLQSNILAETNGKIGLEDSTE
jgi:hypothetical protein